MNCQMSEITVTHRDGRVVNLENVYIRGSKIRFMILPDMLKNAPMFKSLQQRGGRGGGPGGAPGGRGGPAMRRGRGRVFGGPRGAPRGGFQRGR